MTLEIRSGDIFASGADALVCAANARGIFGAGQALEVKNRFPESVRLFVEACRNEFVPVKPGQAWLCHRPFSPGPTLIFATVKDDPLEPAKIEWVIGAATALARADVGRTVAVPALGCGLGGLAWTDVRPLLERELARAPDVRWLLYEPREAERVRLAEAIAKRLTRPGLRANVWAKGHRVRVYLASEVDGREGGKRIGGVPLGWLEVSDQLRVTARAERGKPKPVPWLPEVRDLIPNLT